MRRLLPILLVLPLLAAALPAHAQESAAADDDARAHLDMVDNAFLPDRLEVGPSVDVLVTNSGQAMHNVRALDGKSFRTPSIPATERTNFTAPATPGEYGFWCSFHPEMTGVLVVLADEAPPSETTPETPTPDAGTPATPPPVTATPPVSAAPTPGPQREQPAPGLLALLGASGVALVLARRGRA